MEQQTTLQKKIHDYRQQIDVPIIAILATDSQKNSIALAMTILESQYNATLLKATEPSSFVSSFLQIPEKTDIVLIEFPTEESISFYTKAVEPSHAIVLSGDLDEKSKAYLATKEIYQYIEENNKMIFINLEDDNLMKLSKGINKKLHYTKSKKPDAENIPYEVQLINSRPLSVAFLQGRELITVDTTFNEEQFLSIMTAIVLGKYFKVPAPKIKEAIERF